MTLRDVRYAIERVDNLYSDGVVFEGSMARCPWEAGMEIDNLSSSSAHDETLVPYPSHPTCQLRCPPRNCGRTCSPSFSLEQGLQVRNLITPRRRGVLRTPVDKALFLRRNVGIGHASHLYFFRLGTQRLPSGSRCAQGAIDQHVSMRMDVFSSSPNCADQFSCYPERGGMAMRREVAW